MNYNKVRFLVKQIKVSKDDFYKTIKMSEPGFKKMMRLETCKVSTLEAIAEYFSKPIVYFFDEDYTKVPLSDYVVNDAAKSKEQPVSDNSKVDEYKDIIIQNQERIIRLLIDKIGDTMPPDDKTKSNEKKEIKVRGFRSLSDPRFQMLFNEIINKHV